MAVRFHLCIPAATAERIKIVGPTHKTNPTTQQNGNVDDQVSGPSYGPACATTGRAHAAARMPARMSRRVVILSYTERLRSRARFTAALCNALLCGLYCFHSPLSISVRELSLISYK